MTAGMSASISSMGGVRMREFRKVTTVDDLPPGRGMTARVGGAEVAFFNVDGIFHALQGLCPHEGGLLGLGKLSGCVVACPRHGLRFGVGTGAMPGASGGLQVKTFAVKVEGGDVLVAV